ncbi:hypothetical protein ACFOJE_13675 [Azotobacter bryophylli]|uniref:Uncharacterized protein n=1 Tax=Azotobacter bryophylli TaxID=1986537 RepID=A0ABV7AUP9_9GAMM
MGSDLFGSLSGALETPRVPILHFALWVEEGERVHWWRQRLHPAVTATQEQGIHTSIRMEIRSWDEVLPEGLHEVHVIGSRALPTEVFESLGRHAGLLSLHCVGDAETVGADSYSWADEEALATYLETLFANLNGLALIGISWEDYCLHRQQAGRRLGRYARGGDWQSLLPVLLASPEQARQATSVILFLRSGRNCTLGDYVEVVEWLESRLPASCLTTVSVLSGAERGCSAVLLLTVPEAAADVDDTDDDLEYSPEFAEMILEAAAGEFEEVDVDDFLAMIANDLARLREEEGDQDRDAEQDSVT